jgi:hypothetical protein
MSGTTPVENSVNSRIWISDNTVRRYEFAEQSYPYMNTNGWEGLAQSQGASLAIVQDH